MKLIKFLFGLIFTFVIIAVVAAAIIVSMIIDNNFSEPDYLKDAEAVEFNINNILSSGLEDTKNSNKIEVALDEKELSIILKSTASKFNESISQYGLDILTAYVDVNENNELKFTSYFKATYINTSLKGDFSYELKDNVFTFHVNKINLGKIGVTTSLITTFVKEDEINKTLNENLEDSNISFKIDSESFMVSMSLDTLRDMLLDKIEETDELNLYKTLLSLLFRVDNMITLTEKTDKVGIDVNVDELALDSNRDANIPYNIDFEDVSLKVEYLLDNNLIQLEDASLVGTFLVKGYEKLEDEEKNKIDSIDLSSVISCENNLYPGIIVFENETVVDVFTTQVPGDVSQFNGLKLSESNWNNLLLQNDLVGEMYCFARKDSDGYKVSYISIESVYVDIKNDNFELYLTISLNGKSIVLNINVNSPEASGVNVNGTIESLRLGNISLNSEEALMLLTYLDATITEEWIQIDPTNNTIDIDFTTVFASGSLNDLIKAIEALTGNGVHTKFVDSETEDYVLIYQKQ